MANHAHKRRKPNAGVLKAATPANRNAIKSRASIPKTQASQRAPIPFKRDDDILLLGEGDFSFSYSLVFHHRLQWRSLTATTLEGRESLLAKHPQARSYIDAILAVNSVEHTEKNEDHPSNEDVGVESEEDLDIEDGAASLKLEQRTTVLYNVDATKLLKNAKLRATGALYDPKTPRKAGKAQFSRIVFNFPHVGGVTTDVNRQVRHNQQLLHAFFIEAQELLYHGDSNRTNDQANTPSSILVTLFEGEPYTLWNVKDLARSAGLECRRSWSFRWDDYPDYGHARTLGNLRSEQGGNVRRAPSEANDVLTGEVGLEGQEPESIDRKRAWKGNDRPARTYEFGLKPFRANRATASESQPQKSPQRGQRQKLKRRRREDSSSDD